MQLKISQTVIPVQPIKADSALSQHGTSEDVLKVSALIAAVVCSNF